MEIDVNPKWIAIAATVALLVAQVATLQMQVANLEQQVAGQTDYIPSESFTSVIKSPLRVWEPAEVHYRLGTYENNIAQEMWGRFLYMYGEWDHETYHHPDNATLTVNVTSVLALYHPDLNLTEAVDSIYVYVEYEIPYVATYYYYIDDDGNWNLVTDPENEYWNYVENYISSQCVRSNMTAAIVDDCIEFTATHPISPFWGGMCQFFGFIGDNNPIGEYSMFTYLRHA